MAVSATILVVAPDPGMRRSLAFAIEAEGYEVNAVADFKSVLAPWIESAACAVIDEDALEDGRGQQNLRKINIPAILLVDRLQHVPVVPKLQVVEKPMLGDHLFTAILNAFAMGNNAEAALT